MRKKIARLLGLTSSIVIAIIFIITIIFNYNQAVKNTLDDNQDIAHVVSMSIDGFFEEISKTVLTMASNPIIEEALLQSNSQLDLLSEEERNQFITKLNDQWIVSEANDSFVQNYMQNEVANYLLKQQLIVPDRYGEIFLTDKYGKLVSTTGKLTTFAQEHKYWWQASYNEGDGKTFIDDRGYDISVEGYVIGIVVPIYNQNEFIGILKCNINILNFFDQISDEYKEAFAPNVVSIVRTGGLIIYEEGVEPLSSQIPDYYLDNYSGEDFSSVQKNENSEKKLISISQIHYTSGLTEVGFGGSYQSTDHSKGNDNESWVVIYTMDKQLVNSQFFEDTWILVLLVILLLIMFSVFSRMISKSIVKPLEKLTEFANEVGRGNFDQEIEINTADEINILSKSFNDMVKSLKETTASKQELEEEIGKRRAVENEKNLIKAHLRETQKLESINILASGVAHEINNPINGIMNYGQLIMDSCDKEDGNYEYASEIIYETKRVAKIVKNLLLFSRQDKAVYYEVKMEEVVNGTLSLIKTILRHDQITIDINIEKGLPVISCSYSQLQQVLMNMITNSRDALNDKYPEYHVNKKIVINCTAIEKDGEKWIKLSVKDFGMGMTEAVRELMFTPFYTTKGRDKGTGLGLYISFGIIEEHHGELNVESVEGEYTIINIELPISQPFDD